MTNAFNSENYPEGMPDELIVGDRWLWKRTDLGVDYPPADFSLTYSLRLQDSASTEIEITANEDGSKYLIEEPAATTAAFTAGWYTWQAYITRASDSERLTIERGMVEVLPDRDAAATDPRTHVKKMVDLLEAYFEGNIDKSALSYSISTEGGSRSLTRKSDGELREIYQYYLKRWESEVAKARVKRGLGSGFKMRMRLRE